jgi:hypothetical protein
MSTFREDVNGSLEPQGSTTESIKVPRTHGAGASSIYENSTWDLNQDINTVAKAHDCPTVVANHIPKGLLVGSSTFHSNLSSIANNKDDQNYELVL